MPLQKIKVGYLEAAGSSNGQVLVSNGTVASWSNSVLVQGATNTSNGTVGGVLYDTGTRLAESSSFTFNATNPAVTIDGGTVTSSNPVLNLTQTWNSQTPIFTGIRLNVTDTSSNSSSSLISLGTGGGNYTNIFSVRKDGKVVVPKASEANGGYRFDNDAGMWSSLSGTAMLILGAASSAISIFGSSYVSLGANYSFGFSNAANPVSGPIDVILARRGAGNLRFGDVNAATSATVTISSANPAIVSWTSHGLTIGSPVTFTTTGTLPSPIVASTVYYVIYVDANSFQLATSLANALAGTNISTLSSSQSPTHTGYRGASSQRFSFQSVSSGVLTNFPGADTIIDASQGTGSAAGGSIIFRVAPTGASGTTQNALATALTLTYNSLTLSNPQNTGTATDNTTLFVSSPNRNASLALSGSFGGNIIFQDATAVEKGRILYNTSTNYMAFQVNGTSEVFRLDGSAITAKTHLLFSSDNTYDIGASSATRPRNVYVAGTGTFGGSLNALSLYAADDYALGWLSRGIIKAPSNGVFTLLNSLQTDFNRLQFGGTTSAFPSLKRSSTTLIARLADDTADAPIQALSGTFSDTSVNTSSLLATGYSLTGSSAVSMVDLSGAWNTSGTPTAFKLNITSDVSNASSLLMDLQVASASKFKVSKTGAVTATTGTFSDTTTDVSSIAVSGYSLTGSTALPLMDLSGTWNTTGTPTAIKLAITDTASNASSLLMDLQSNISGAGMTSKFSIDKNGTAAAATGFKVPNRFVIDYISGNTGGRLTAGISSQTVLATFGLDISTPTFQFHNNTVVGWGNGTNSVNNDLILTRKAAANLRLGTFDAVGKSTTVTVTNATDIVNWTAHGLMTGSAVQFTSGGTLPGGISANTTYYVNVVSADTFKIYTTYDGAVAGGATALVDITNDGSGTHTAYAAQTQQSLSVQNFTGTDIPGSPLVINGAQGTGLGQGGSIIFRLAPATTTGSTTNSLSTIMSINSDRTVSIGGLTINPLNGGVTFRQTFGITIDTSNAMILRHGNTDGVWIKPQSTGIPNIVWVDQSNVAQTALYAEATNVLAQRNGLNAQAFRVYNTYSSGTSFERGNFSWIGNTLTIGTEKGSGGGSARPLAFQTDGTTRLILDTNGMLDFGGSTSAFPSLKRNSTALEVRLADDTAYAPISASTFTSYSTAANTSTMVASDYSLTGSSSVSMFDLSGTWNTTGTPTAIKLAITDTNSNASSLLMDLQSNIANAGMTSKFSVSKSGTVSFNTLSATSTLSVVAAGTAAFEIGASISKTRFEFWLGDGSLANPAILRRRGAANLQLGAADAAAPVPQTLSVQSVVTGTANTAGANFTITGSQGTGTGAGGSIIFQVAPATTNGNTPNNLANTVVLASDKSATFEGTVKAAATFQCQYVTIGSGAYGATIRNYIEQGGDGILRITNSGANDFDRLQFGGSSNLYPALKRSSAKIQVVDGAGNFTSTSGIVAQNVNVQGVTIANLPASPAAGDIAHVTDGDSGIAWGDTVVNSGSGATRYLVWYNGSAWTVYGK